MTSESALTWKQSWPLDASVEQTSDLDRFTIPSELIDHQVIPMKDKLACSIDAPYTP